MNGTNPTENARPTEAQLRWAQFHHKRRAARVRSRVQAFWQTPSDPADVPGALPEDGGTTSGTETAAEAVPSSARPRSSKPTVSRGRRALLRVSRRNYQRRRERIVQYGYGIHAQYDEGEGGTDNAPRPDEEEDDEHDDLLRSIFTKPTRRRRVRTYNKGLDAATERRLRNQFHEACQAMMNNLAAATPEQNVVVPTKRWTRTQEHRDASRHFHYDDVHWGMKQPSKSKGEHKEVLERMFKPLDSGASWMVHMPKKQLIHQQSSYILQGHYRSMDETSDGGNNQHPQSSQDDSRPSMALSTLQPQTNLFTFDQLVDVVQRQLLSNRSFNNNDIKKDTTTRSVPKMRLRYFLPGEQPDGTAEQSDRTRASTKSTDENDPDKNIVVARTGTTHERSSATSSQSQSQSQPQSQPHFSADSSAILEKARMFEQMQSTDTTTAAQHMQTSHVSTAVRDKAPHTKSVESSRIGQMREQYLRTMQAQQQPSSSSSQRRCTDDVLFSTNLCQHCSQTKMRESGIHVAEIVDPLPTTPASGATLLSDTSQASSPRPNDGVTSVCLICHEEYRKGPRRNANGKRISSSSYDNATQSVDDSDSNHSGDQIQEQQGVVGKLPKSLRDRFSVGQKSSDDSNMSLDNGDARSDVSAGRAFPSFWSMGKKSIESAMSGLNPITETAADNNDENVTAQTKNAPDLKARVARMSGRVGDFFSKARPSLDSKYGDDETGDLDAMAAFRKSQDKRRESGLSDDSSSMSSFRVIPGFRKVVQDLQQLTPKSQSSSRRSISGAQSTYGSEVTLSHVEKLMDNHARSSLERAGSIIDTDGAMSDVGGTAMDPSMLGNLLLSPTLLNKRLQQAISAIENRQWDQVLYLISANPWLAEMTQITTNQYLLHKLAFYGADAPPCLTDLNKTLLELFPPAVHKFDQDGNVPLHLSSAAGNLPMIKLLGESFPGGASVRNEDGMLPLHFTIATIREVVERRKHNQVGETGPSESAPTDSIDVIKAVLKFFPKAVAVEDNDGNLPIHIAAACLNGPVGVDVIYILLDEAERQVRDPMGARFYSKVKFEDITDADSAVTMSTEHETSSTIDNDDSAIHCTMVKNKVGETPLLTAILAGADWEMIEAIVGGPGGSRSAMMEDADKNNALHLLLSRQYLNPPAALSVLKVAPKAVCRRNSSGMLPIEYACMATPPTEVILALALADLPFNIGQSDQSDPRNEHGQSWWFLTCECDDQYVEIVKHVVSICTYEQVRKLCFLKGGPARGSQSVLSRATPLCRQVLTTALRFVGRFEFLGSAAVASDPTAGLKVFDALDFGTSDGGDYHEGRRVLLSCFSQQQPFLEKTSVLQLTQLDPLYIEEVLTFVVKKNGESSESVDSNAQYCLSVERPTLTLDGVVSGMMKNSAYQQDPSLRNKYSAKVAAVLRLIAKSLRHLHTNGVIHGDLCGQKCGKFDDGWKLMGRFDVQQIGQPFQYIGGTSVPPEAIEDEDPGDVADSDSVRVFVSQSLDAQTSIDVWGFGKLAYEVLVGKDMVEFQDPQKASEDIVGLLELMEWNEDNLRRVFEDLLDVGIPESGADLIASCLLPDPLNRPRDMDEVLDSPFWKEMRKHRQPSKRRKNPSNGLTSLVDS